MEQDGVHFVHSDKPDARFIGMHEMLDAVGKWKHEGSGMQRREWCCATNVSLP